MKYICKSFYGSIKISDAILFVLPLFLTFTSVIDMDIVNQNHFRIKKQLFKNQRTYRFIHTHYNHEFEEMTKNFS